MLSALYEDPIGSKVNLNLNPGKSDSSLSNLGLEQQAIEQLDGWR